MFFQMQFVDLLKGHHLEKLTDKVRTFLLTPEQEIEESIDVRLCFIFLGKLAVVAIGDELVE